MLLLVVVQEVVDKVFLLRLEVVEQVVFYAQQIFLFVEIQLIQLLLELEVQVHLKQEETMEIIQL